MISLCGTAPFSLKSKTSGSNATAQATKEGEAERWSEIQRFHTFSTRRARRARDSSAKNLGLKRSKLKSICLRSWELEFSLTVLSSAIRERACCQVTAQSGLEEEQRFIPPVHTGAFYTSNWNDFSSLRRSGKFPHRDEITKLCINNSRRIWQPTAFLPQPPPTELYDVRGDAPDTQDTAVNPEWPRMRPLAPRQREGFRVRPSAAPVTSLLSKSASRNPRPELSSQWRRQDS